MTGILRAQDPRMQDSTRYHAWRYAGKEGEKLTISMKSTAFASYLYLVVVEGGRTVTIAEDDGSAGSDAHISVELPATDTYYVIANASEAGGLGAYTLRLDGQAAVAKIDWAARFPGGGDSSGRYALLVGIEKYPNPKDNLVGTRNDARIMRDILVKRYGFKPENVITLEDEEASRDAIIQGFQRHLGQAGPDGVAVFYYSGHGMQMDDNYGIRAPQDPEPDGKDESLVVWGAEGKATAILDDELGILANQLRTSRTLVVLDACYSGTGTRGPGRSQRKRVSFQETRSKLVLPVRFLGQESAGASKSVGKGPDGLEPERHILLAASSDDESSWTGNGWPKYGDSASVFTFYMADALDEGLGDKPISELMRRASAQTSAWVKKNQARSQIPRAEGTRVNETLANYLAPRRPR